MYLLNLKKMLDGETTLNTVSSWIPCAELNTLSLAVSGIVDGDEVTVQGSNDHGVTAVPTNTFTVGSVVSTNELVTVDARPKWLRVKLTAVAGGGSVTVMPQATGL